MKATEEMINAGSLMGGTLKEIPLPHVRMSQVDGVKRNVSISVTTYTGSCPWAKHYYVGIHVEHNKIWNSETKQWQQPWEDPDGWYRFPGGGCPRSKSFSSNENAVKYAKSIAKRFSSKRFDVTFSALTDKDEKLLRDATMRAREGD